MGLLFVVYPGGDGFSGDSGVTGDGTFHHAVCVSSSYVFFESFPSGLGGVVRVTVFVHCLHESMPDGFFLFVCFCGAGH